MKGILIITPVKDSIELTLKTVKAIMASDIKVPYIYRIYNDFSTPENCLKLEEASKSYGFELVHLSNLTNHPSPNYRLVLQLAQAEAIRQDYGLIIIESDVVVEKDTIQKLFEGAEERLDCGIAASVTVDENKKVNFPYLFAKNYEKKVYSVKKRFSFCCSLLTVNFLKSYDFHKLNPEKNWYDVFISHQAIKEGFKNYLFMNLPVLHRPHSSRPWKLLKYTNPLKYYWLKYTKKLDKI